MGYREGMGGEEAEASGKGVYGSEASGKGAGRLLVEWGTRMADEVCFSIFVYLFSLCQFGKGE